jgi:hypothetical protein
MKIRFKIRNSSIFKNWSILTLSENSQEKDIIKTINVYCNNFLGVYNIRNNSDISWEEISMELKKTA